MLCFFIGHRDAELELMPQIEAAVHRHITEDGVTEFIVGQYGAFDRMAARAVINAKRHYPNITLSILCPITHLSEVSTPPMGMMIRFILLTWRKSPENWQSSVRTNTWLTAVIF